MVERLWRSLGGEQGQARTWYFWRRDSHGGISARGGCRNLAAVPVPAQMERAGRAASSQANPSAMTWVTTRTLSAKLAGPPPQTAAYSYWYDAILRSVMYEVQRKYTPNRLPRGTHA